MGCPWISPDPLPLGDDGGRPSTLSSDADRAKHEGILAPVGQAGRKAGHFRVKSERQDAANQWVGNQPEVGGTDTANNFEIEPDVADPATADARLDHARAH